MKRALPVVIVVGMVGLVAWWGLRSQGQRPSTPPTSAGQPVTPPPATPTPAAEGETIVYTFADDAAVRAFAALWQQRQNIVVRLAVMQVYWNTEQGAVDQLNEQLKTQYSLDPSKNYTLNAEQRTLVEHAAAAPPTEAVATGQPPTAAPDSADHVIHTFSGEEELEAFGTLWQARQSTAVRMAVLKSYWDQDKTELTRLSDKLTADYQVDPAKNYQLDTQRRVLVERPAPPAPVLPDAGGAVPTDLPAAAAQPAGAETPTAPTP